ncbi:TPA: hypothetical protein DD449_01740 [Candidatus Berkelbacteria bacterium]|uniref:Pectate lyase superfamily protein domain-containing protein n=1 Tax=Berkelbacteria bacterium GW2011_GWE1_39_12 TaxID=1618337 RepID=A0A0G4B538_9BACT|nr:MAG: hypothetical protein UT28_C0001G0738 [Berkelbacteria bacterium GW2011_GWE1_39_12]HBO60387.1 hypothetical protein [Candidatus Berkelbacteria bacterium]
MRQKLVIKKLFKNKSFIVTVSILLTFVLLLGVVIYRQRASAIELTTSASVMIYGAKGDGITDDTAAIQKAVNSVNFVYFPGGIYKVSYPITLRSNVRVHGASASSTHIKQAFNTSDSNKSSEENIFVVRGNYPNFITNVTVDNFTFDGIAGTDSIIGTALDVIDGRNIVFSGNTVNNMNLFSSGVHYPINVWDGTSDPARTAGLTNDLQLNYNISVINNTGAITTKSPNRGLAIGIKYSRTVQVSNNRLTNYNEGLTWWGGDANPSRGGKVGNPRWVKNLTIKNNNVKNTWAGIWGSMGDGILVDSNYVERCDDVCLDAEGSNNVTFSNNQAKNAGYAVLATWHFSNNVNFVKNTVTQDGSYYKGDKGRNLYSHSNDTNLVGNINIKLESNSLNYTGADGIGYVTKSASRTFKANLNYLKNVVFKFDQNNSCGFLLTSNTFDLTKNIGNESVIYADKVWPDGASAICNAVVQNNQIKSSVNQSSALAGIDISATGYNTTTDNTISGNSIAGFAKSIHIYGNSGNIGIIEKFHILNNKVSGRIVDNSPKGRSVNDFSGNVDFSGKIITPVVQ